MKHLLHLSLLATLLIRVSFAHNLEAQAKTLPLDRLQEAYKETALDAIGSTPFHLKLTVDVTPQLGRQAQHGTIEMWWASRDVQRIDYDLPPYRASIVHTLNGDFSTPDAGPPPYIPDHLLQEVLHPLPSKIDSSLFRVETYKRTLMQLPFDCIALHSAKVNADQDVSTYCFDSLSQLRVTIAGQDQFTIRRSMGTIGKIHVPLNLEYTFLDKSVGHTHIEILQVQPKAYPESTDINGLISIPRPAIRVSGGAVAGLLIHKPDPIYPEQAKQRHISGSVVLRAIIGTDGKVRDLSLIGSPDDLLTKSAMDAVSRWTYAPYLLNGVLTDVDTTVTVNFVFSR